MLWLQALPLFGLWVAYAFLIRRWVQGGRQRYLARSRAWRMIAMAASIFGSLAVLVACFFALKGFGLGGIGYGLAAVAGLAFVHLQSLAVALTLSLAVEGVTRRVPAPSDKRMETTKERVQ